jgi:hypothetical protein
MWKSHKEVYDEVLQIGSALQQLGVKPVRSETSISILGFTPDMLKQTFFHSLHIHKNRTH